MTRVINDLFACDNARIIIFSTYGRNFQNGQSNRRHWKDIFVVFVGKVFQILQLSGRTELTLTWYAWAACATKP